MEREAYLMCEGRQKMDFQKMNLSVNNKKLLPVYIGGAVLALALGIVIFATVVAQAASTFFAVMGSIMGVLSILEALAIAAFIFLSYEGEANFFLYDRKTGRNLTEDELTFDRINARMGYYMTLIAASQEQMWERNILERNDARFGEGQVYKPLTAYKMLYDLAELDKPAYWELFTGADPETITTLCKVLTSCGEGKMADALLDVYEGAESIDDIEDVRDFIKGNAKYLRRRMREYVLKHIEEFY